MGNELNEFLRVMNAVSNTYRRLPDKAATMAVNFSKERFRQSNWVGERTIPWKKRSTAKNKRDASRAILVKTANLKRDVHKISVTTTVAVIGTSRLTGAYARAHNEGFKGTVQVKSHRRARHISIRETYTTKKGNERTRTRRTIDTSKPSTVVKAHSRKMNLVQRQFLGASPVMNKQIEKMMADEYIKAIRNA